MEVTKYIKEELIELNLHCQSKEELFKVVFDKTFSNGYVKEEFLERITDRENNFPTGIPLNPHSIAIPHTDAELVKNQFISIVVLDHPVEFKSMEDPSQTTQVKVAFVLGLNDPKNQLAVLQEIMGLIQDESQIEKIIQAKNKTEILEVFQNN